MANDDHHLSFWPMALFLSYMGLGFPGISYPYNYHLLGWNDFGREIEVLVNRLEHETGEKNIGRWYG
ncbi:hypothetical protein E4P82_14420 [Candidatus Competibacter phosphatis]|uniref:Uncharacterized protein n=1 Tax=Candidatus Competibacter phosphatis TaxID=221280 RepID=A0ABX1TQA7_9GAMM|nr:hypothetical protein [Candidatus Competibacter phosphatis]NMQ20283.1 hypothetical protein [Candidatus Competibacter phosphatis]